MQKLIGVLILGTLLFSSCSSSKYYFKMRGFGNAKEPIEKITEEPNTRMNGSFGQEIALNKKTEKDSSAILVTEEKEIIKEETELPVVSDKDLQTKLETSEMKEKVFHTKTKRKDMLPVVCPGVKKIKHVVSAPRNVSFKEKRFVQQQSYGKTSSVDWEQVFLDTLYVIGLLGLIALGLAMEGTLTLGYFLGVILAGLLGAILFGFLIWLLFHNFIDGIRESRSRR